MKPEAQKLIDDLLADETRRDATLLAGAKVLYRRRQWRLAWRSFALILLASATALVVDQKRTERLARISTFSSKPAALPQTQSLSDDQLLSLFPNTPVALATLPNGKKLLIFPRASDAAKFVTHL